MTKDYAPIVLFVYNRPWHTQQTVEALQKNLESAYSDIIIYSDAAKTKEQEEPVLEVRKYINSIRGFRSIKLIEQTENKGLADSIITGVTEVVNKYGRIIVLEDDIVTSPYFLKYMNEALEFYKDEEKVMHISGYVPELNILDNNETFFIKPTTCWGWGTWKESWTFFEKNIASQEKLFSSDMIKDFNLNGAYDYWSHFQMNKSGELNTWAVFWYVSVFLKSGLSLHPNKSLVQNIGHDGTGENCTLSQVDEKELSSYSTWTFTNDYKVSYEAEILSYYKSKTNRTVMYKIKALIKKVFCK